MLWKAIVLINLLFLTACNNLNPTASELNSSSKYPATSYGNNLKVCLEGQSLYCNFNELSQEDKLKIVNADSPYSSVQNTNSVSTRQVKSISNAKQVQKTLIVTLKKIHLAMENLHVQKLLAMVILVILPADPNSLRAWLLSKRWHLCR